MIAVNYFDMEDSCEIQREGKPSRCLITGHCGARDEKKDVMKDWLRDVERDVKKALSS